MGGYLDDFWAYILSLVENNAMPPFSTQDYLDFFVELEIHNHKSWFDRNRDRYHQSVREPFIAFLSALALQLNETMGNLETDGRKCLMRINRDLRFARDKAPYHTRMGGVISPLGAKDKNIACFFLKMSLAGIHLWAGIHNPEKFTLEAIRKKMLASPEDFLKIATNKKVVSAFGKVEGESLKRFPKEMAKAMEQYPFIAQKSFYLHTHLPAQQITADNLLEQVYEKFSLTVPFVQWLMV